MFNEFFLQKSEEHIIGDIYFSNEELEIIAAILKHKTEKQAAKFLNTSLQEIEPVIFSVIKKINGSSIDDIFALFAAPNHLEIISKFFLMYIISKNFNKILKELSILTPPNTKCFIIDSTESEYTNSRKTSISNILNKIGFTVMYLDSSIENLKYPEKSIILSSEMYFKNSSQNLPKNSIYFTENFQDTRFNCYSENASNFYFAVLDIIDLLLKNNKVNALIQEFKKECINEGKISHKTTPLEKFYKFHRSFCQVPLLLSAGWLRSATLRSCVREREQSHRF